MFFLAQEWNVCVWTNQKFYKKGQRFCVFFSPSNLSTHLGFDKSFFFWFVFSLRIGCFFHPLCDRSTDHSTISMCKDYPFDLLRFCTTRCLTIAFQCFVSNCVKCALFLRSPLNGKTFSNKTAYKKIKEQQLRTLCHFHSHIQNFVPHDTKAVNRINKKSHFQKGHDINNIKDF